MVVSVCVSDGGFRSVSFALEYLSYRRDNTLLYGFAQLLASTSYHILRPKVPRSQRRRCRRGREPLQFRDGGVRLSPATPRNV